MRFLAMFLLPSVIFLLGGLCGLDDVSDVGFLQTPLAQQILGVSGELCVHFAHLRTSRTFHSP